MYWLVGGIGVPLIQWLKVTIGLKGKKAMLLTVVVAVVLGFASLFVSSQLELADFTWVNIVSVFAQVFTASQLAYKLLAKEE